MTLRSDVRELRNLREQLRSFFADSAIGIDIADDLILVANELTTNAIEAAALGSDVTVEVHVDPRRITLAVENVGPPFTLPDEVVLPDESRPRGRGLALTSRIVDDLCTEPMVDGTRIVATCRRH
jgi:anti-sigma regulatory factor (Ser/Thr protein kinase)